MNQGNRANAEGKLKKNPSVRNATLLESFLEPLLQSMASSIQALRTATEHSILQCTAVLLVAMWHVIRYSNVSAVRDVQKQGS